MKTEYLIIANGLAARKHCKKLNVCLGRLKRGGIEFKIIETEKPGHATTIARKAFQEGYRNFISAGGDGTTFEIINGIYPKAISEACQLGFIPLGTGNSFIRDYTDQQERYTVEAIVRNRSRLVDLIKLDHTKGTLFYLNLLSFGFIADVANIRNRFFSAFGELGYKLAVMLKSLGEKIYQFEIGNPNDNQATLHDLLFLSFHNSKFTGGKMMLAPKASAEDGKMDMLTSNPLMTEEIFKLFPMTFNGSHLSNKNVHSNQVSEVFFQHEKPMLAMIDGEVLHCCPKQISVQHKALRVML